MHGDQRLGLADLRHKILDRILHLVCVTRNGGGHGVGRSVEQVLVARAGVPDVHGVRPCCRIGGRGVERHLVAGQRTHVIGGLRRHATHQGGRCVKLDEITGGQPVGIGGCQDVVAAIHRSDPMTGSHEIRCY